MSKGGRQSKRPRHEKTKAETELISEIRSAGLANPEAPGIPIILCKEGTFVVLYQSTLRLLSAVPLKTLAQFSEDVHGSGRVVLDTENLTSKEGVAFVKVLAACIEAETTKEKAIQAAMQDT